MKFLAAVALALTFFACAAATHAAEPGTVSHASLARMGFAAAQPVSDAEGLSIRGRGTPIALSAGHQVAHGATTAFVFNLNISVTGSKSARAFSFGIARGSSF